MGATILIVEDNELNQKLFRDLVAAMGHRAVSATSGREGIIFAEQHPLHLAIVDLLLPDISGLEVIAALRREPRLRRLPVLAASAFRSSVSAAWLRRHRCDAFVAKPISVQAFTQEVGRLLRGVPIAASEMPPTLLAAAPLAAPDSNLAIE
jgi:two-component system cell cycle response regulator DivK